MVLAALLALLLLGCGLKSNPVPLASIDAKSLADPALAVSAQPDAAVLNWRLESANRVRYTLIERSTLGSPGNICRDCPRAFRTIERLEAQNAGANGPEYSFSDSSVEKGKTYSYRLQLCDEAGVCRESQTVEIDFQ